MEKIGVVIPAYNETSTIDTVLTGLPKTLKVRGMTYQFVVIVVNDGSRDTTAALVAKHAGVVLINHLVNSGAGAATRTGLRYARETGYKYAITMDADGQHDPRDMQRVATELITSGQDMIIGSRLLNHRGMPWYRVLGNRGLTFITLLLFGVKVSDSQSGLKGLSHKALQRITFRSDRYAFCSEMIWRAHQEHLTIKEVPIQAIYTEYSLGKGQGNLGAGVTLVGQLVKHRIMEFIHG